MQDNVQKATSILDLSLTGNRTQTIGSLLENVLYLYNEMLTADQICGYVQDIFAIRLSLTEVNSVLSKLVESGNVSERGGKYIVTDECYKRISAKEVLLSGAFHNRQRTYLQIIKTVAPDISEAEAKEFWAVFTSYVCHCAYSYFSNNIKLALSEGLEITEYILYDELILFFAKKIKNAEHQHLFVSSCAEYINNLDANAINYYETLGKNLISYYTLAFPQFWEKDIDWVIFADSDFLSAVLSLDNKPETLACKALLKLAEGNRLNIKFKFLPITLMELTEQRARFEKLIPTDIPDARVVKTMLETGGLDSFSKTWYEQYLNDNNTLHPARWIDNAEKTLTAFAGFEKCNYRFETVFNEEYISSSISGYKKYVGLANGTRVLNGYEPAKRTTEQLQHDVFLSEAIGQLRKTNSNQSVVYIGLSIDDFLIDYNERGNNGAEIPRFFRPSLLLNILSRFLPVTSEENKVAFVKSMLSPGVSENIESSVELQEFVSYYSQRGLSDEKLLRNFINDRPFLKEFIHKNEIERSRFFESELTKRATDAGYKASELIKQLNNVMLELALTKQDANSNEVKIKLQENEIQALKQKQILFENELKKLAEEKNKELQGNKEFKTLVPQNAEMKEEAALEPDFDNPNTTAPTAPVSNNKAKKRVFAGIGVLALVCLVGMLLAAGVIYFDFGRTRGNKTIENETPVKSTVAMTEWPLEKVNIPDSLNKETAYLEKANDTADLKKESNSDEKGNDVSSLKTETSTSGKVNNSENAKNESSVSGINTLPAKVVKKVVPVAVKPAEKRVQISDERAKSEAAVFESKVINDLVGTKLSGCGIVIKSTSEIAELTNLVLVEKLSSGALKYKFTAKINKGTETYSAAPYIYYTVDGTFIKVDGTNCE